MPPQLSAERLARRDGLTVRAPTASERRIDQIEMEQSKTGVLLVNVGTPDSPGTADVRNFLREFLMDGRVIDIPFWRRFLLVNLIVAPFRAPKSAREYRKLWTDTGSPLLLHSLDFKELLQQKLGDRFIVELAMRYQAPSMESGLESLRQHHPSTIVVFPLFPQYASATAGSVHQKAMQIIQEWDEIPRLSLIDGFFNHPKMIAALADRGRQHLDREGFDHVIFSFHGLPERQLKKSSDYCLTASSCCDAILPQNQFCYKAQCFSTSRLLAGALDLEDGSYTVSFQSRLGKDPWIRPYTSEVVEDLAARGTKKILAFSPSFVVDCLETTIEIGEECREHFQENGGEELRLVESLNAHPLWIEAAQAIVMKSS